MEKLYDALVAANVPDDKARAAAVEAAQHESRFDAVETRIAAVEGRLTLLTWMVGSLTAVVAAVGLPALWLLTRIAAKVGIGF